MPPASIVRSISVTVAITAGSRWAGGPENPGVFSKRNEPSRSARHREVKFMGKP